MTNLVHDYFIEDGTHRAVLGVYPSTGDSVFPSSFKEVEPTALARDWELWVGDYDDLPEELRASQK